MNSQKEHWYHRKEDHVKYINKVIECPLKREHVVPSEQTKDGLFLLKYQFSEPVVVHRRPPLHQAPLDEDGVVEEVEEVHR